MIVAFDFEKKNVFFDCSVIKKKHYRMELLKYLSASETVLSQCSHVHKRTSFCQFGKITGDSGLNTVLTNDV